MSVSRAQADSRVEWLLRTITGSVSLIILSVGVIMTVTGYIVAVTNLHPLVGSMFGIWGGTAVLLGGIMYTAFTVYRHRANIASQTGRDFFSE